ncbi:MAG: alpha-amylase family glycosyl hydrolase [Bacteroidales bacterium]
MFAMLAVMLVVAACGNQKPQTDVEVLVSTVSHPEWSKNAIMYEVNVRQFTPEGTFNAFAEHMPRLREMGVDILWFMPITPIGVKERKGTLGSYYSVKDYTAVNPEFGTLEDFKNIVKQAHQLGMYVIVDWVANHTAWDHPWTQTHPEFFYLDEQGNKTPPHNTDWSDVIQLDYENKELWDAMIGEMRFWLEEANIDGFRCDVAYLVPTEFWNQARKELEKVKPIFMLAEADHPELMEHAFNAGYSWTSHHAMNRIANGEDNVSALDRYFFEENMGNYPVGTYKILFIDNHDENSWAGTVFERLGEAMQVMAVLTHTATGMPLLYSGQEAGLDRRLEFFEKDKIDWTHLPYETFFRTLAQLKKDNKALWNGLAGGPMVRVNTHDDEKIFAFTREKDGNKVFVVLNLSNQPQQVSFSSGNFAGSYTEMFSGENALIDTNTVVDLESWGYKIFVN